jgi:hypothetical protein
MSDFMSRSPDRLRSQGAQSPDRLPSVELKQVRPTVRLSLASETVGSGDTSDW